MKNFKNYENLVRRHLGSKAVIDVQIEPETNFDGEKILQVDVIYDASAVQVSSAMTIEITNELWKLSGDAFPVMNFISSVDLEGNRAA